MAIPNLTSKLYILASIFIPEGLKPTLRGLYYGLTKIILYRTLNMFAAIDIETTSECNLKCGYCPTAYYNRGKHLMTEKLFKKIIDELATIPYKGRISPHFYGEPLLDERLPNLLSYARKKLPLSTIIIHTNGLLLKADVFRRFLNAGVDGFLVTLHNDFIAQKITDIFKELKPEERKKIRTMDLVKKSLFNRGGLVTHHKIKKLKRCFYLSDEIAVSYAGDLVCTNDFFANHKFGNLNQENLLDVWNKPAFIKTRKDLLRGRFILEICKQCTKE